MEVAIRAFANQEFASCLKASREAQRQDPGSATPPFFAGLCAEREGMFHDAYQAFARSRRLDPDEPDVHNNLVRLALKTVDVRRATRDLSQFAKRFPLDPRLEELRTEIKGLKEIRAHSGLSDAEIRDVILRSYFENEGGGRGT
jgi:Flp pilus assembly protein TadD